MIPLYCLTYEHSKWLWGRGCTGSSATLSNQKYTPTVNMQARPSQFPKIMLLILHVRDAWCLRVIAQTIFEHRKSTIFKIVWKHNSYLVTSFLHSWALQWWQACSDSDSSTPANLASRLVESCKANSLEMFHSSFLIDMVSTLRYSRKKWYIFWKLVGLISSTNFSQHRLRAKRQIWCLGYFLQSQTIELACCLTLILHCMTAGHCGANYTSFRPASTRFSAGHSLLFKDTIKPGVRRNASFPIVKAALPKAIDSERPEGIAIRISLKSIGKKEGKNTHT